MKTFRFISGIITTLVFFAVIIIYPGCKKSDNSSNNEQSAPTVTTNAITGITPTTASCGGNVTSQGSSVITARGVCWSTSQNPTASGSHTSDGTGTGNFSSSLTGLNANTPYYVRAYVTNSTGTSYGSQVSFTTTNSGTVPTVTTNSVTNIAQTTASSGGNVTLQGTSSVTARGVCWSTSQNPSILDQHTTDGTGIGNFTSNLTGLNPNTPYYVRAYATNSFGTSYGNQVTFSTSGNLTLPTVSTTAISNITPTTATGGGNVTSDGGVPVTARGICWNTSSSPTIANNHTTDSTGTGIFTSNITGLNPNTPYYVRAYATNSVGLTYGNEVNFTTMVNDGEPCPGIPTITYEGQTYNTVHIGNQCWFKENLNVGTMIDGGLEQSNNGIIEKYCYGNDTNYCTIYGGLYQWDEMMQYVTTANTKGICPTGWHVPVAGWNTLIPYLGGGSVAGGKMKEAGTAHWQSPNDATNSSGFTALPSGSRGSFGYFNGLTTMAYLWTSYQTNTANACALFIVNYSSSVLSDCDQSKTWGRAVRCMKDE